MLTVVGISVLLLAALIRRQIPQRPPRPGPRISRLDANGLAVEGVSAAWSDVKEIVTYKHDFFGYDMVCVTLVLQDARRFEIWEEDPRFDSLAAELLRHFPSIPAGWYQEVCLPAFEPKYRVLWHGA